MSGTSVTGQISHLQGQFAKNATVTPHKAMAAAESFIHYVTTMAEAGLKPSAGVREDGHNLGKQLDHSTVLYEFNAGVELHTITCPQELNTRAEEIESQISRAHNIRDRLMTVMTATFA